MKIFNGDFDVNPLAAMIRTYGYEIEGVTLSCIYLILKS